jgi:hypothetical protein
MDLRCILLFREISMCEKLVCRAHIRTRKANSYICRATTHDKVFIRGMEWWEKFFTVGIGKTHG